jgi:hypothetical protein
MSQISKQALIVDNSQSFPTNNAGDITPSDLRAFNVNMINSLVDEISYQSFTASVTNSINLLNQFSASQQPSFTALNNFTASQLTINTGYNAATHSLNASVNSLTAEVDQLQIWSSSVNQISDNGIVQGYSTRLHFYGLVSASIVPNVNGAIASINIEQDGTKLDSSSFNSYTASTNQRVDSLEVWSGSAKISISALNTFTQSVGPIQTGSLLTTASYSGTTITYTKGNATTFTNVGIQNTASFNSYTASINAFTASNGNTSLNTYTASNDTKWTTLGSLTGSLSSSVNQLNQFTASQNTKNATLAPITASLLQSQSAYDVKWNTLSAVTSSYNLFTASVNSYTASNNTKWNTLGLLTSSFATTGSNSFTGSQTITGSVYGNIIALSIASSTASIDLSQGNFFTLTLANSVNTHISASNVKAGQTINLLVTQGSAAGTISFNPQFKFATGYAYSASAVNNAKDLVSFATFDTSNIYGAAIKNLV